MIALVAWLGLVGALAVRGGNEHAVEPIDPDAMVLGPSQERWMGIFFQDQQVGFAVRRTSPVEGGSTLFEGRSQFQVATFGKLQQVSTAGTALVDPSGVLERFDFIMLADQVRLVARGEVAGQEIVMEIDQAGETSILRFPISKPPQVGMSLEGAIRRQDLRVGHSFAVPYFDPLTLAEGEMRFDVTDVEVMASGEEAYWLKARFGEIETRSLITPSGETLRQEGSLGMSMVRMTAKEAQVLSGGEPIDLIDASAVPLEPGQTRLDSPRQTRVLKVRVKGVSVDKIPSNPPHQVVTGDTVRIETPLALELPAQPFIRDVPGQWLKREIIGPELQPRPPEWTESSPALGLLSALDPYNLRSTPTIPAQHRDWQYFGVLAETAMSTLRSLSRWPAPSGLSPGSRPAWSTQTESDPAEHSTTMPGPRYSWALMWAGWLSTQPSARCPPMRPTSSWSKATWTVKSRSSAWSDAYVWS
jgi:hypothetical protein